MYLIGIDVGGTFTDGALTKSGTILHSNKTATNNFNLSESLFTTLDKLLVNVSDTKLIERIVISTTAVTNLLATGNVEPTALVLIPGYGLPNSYYKIGDYTYFLKGVIDFRGNETEEINRDEVEKLIKEIKKLKIKRIAIAGKFSNRNNKHEELVKELFNKLYPEALVLTSSSISNQLNFSRRAATTYYTSMIYHEWNNFVDNVEKALEARNIQTEVHVLKADGGTVPLEVSRMYPCQTIYSGPAASTMGGVALTMDNTNSVVIDIGGTTSDISLLIEGEPLHASKGAVIKDRFTHVDAFSVTSLPLGGDSQITFTDDKIGLDKRVGVAACFGGKGVTVTDVFNTFYELEIGDYENSLENIKSFADKHDISVDVVTKEAINIVLNSLETAIEFMFKQWEKEPAYKVWEVVNERKFKLERIIGVGAASTAIVPVLAKHLNVSHFIHEYSPVANALGTSVTRPTINVNLHVDTENSYYSIEPGGFFDKITNSFEFNIEDAKELALNHLHNTLKERGISGYDDEATFYMEEQFNVIRGWNRGGRIFDIGVQIKPGFINEFTGVADI
ncbi:MAG TPA: hydantoinase/oxoprolinase family protein [Syntrophomonadaceae bacterium]|nr:hydantoinase/oxoprolinase family protein [Syntrophomonadaceae bacterium]